MALDLNRGMTATPRQIGVGMALGATPPSKSDGRISRILCVAPHTASGFSVRGCSVEGERPFASSPSSNHRCDDRRPPGCPAIRHAAYRPFCRLRLSLADSPAHTDRIEFTCRGSSRPGYGLAILSPGLSTPPCGDAVTAQYRTIPHRTETDSHRSIQAPTQAHGHDLHAASLCASPTGQVLVRLPKSVAWFNLRIEAIWRSRP